MIVTPTTSEAHFLELAIERNATHGLQLSLEDKQDMARKIYNNTPAAQRDEKKKHLAKILSVSERTIRNWLSRIDKDAKEARNKRIFQMWLACHTQEEIAEEVGCPQQKVADQVGNFTEIGRLAESGKSLALHATDFEPPLYWSRLFNETFEISKGPDFQCRLLSIYLVAKFFDLPSYQYVGTR